MNYMLFFYLMNYAAANFNGIRLGMSTPFHQSAQGGGLADGLGCSSVCWPTHMRLVNQVKAPEARGSGQKQLVGTEGSATCKCGSCGCPAYLRPGRKRWHHLDTSTPGNGGAPTTIPDSRWQGGPGQRVRASHGNSRPSLNQPTTYESGGWLCFNPPQSCPHNAVLLPTVSRWSR